MIDTMTITYRFSTKAEYQKAIDTVNNYINERSFKNALHKEYAKLITYAFAKYGLEELYFKSNKNKGCYVIYILLHPRLLIEENDYIHTLHNCEISEVRENFNYLIQKQIGLNVPDLFLWKIQRIDYAVDIEIKQKLIPIYLNLFKRGNIPSIALNNDITKKYFDCTNNVYCVSKTYSINFYDRYTTLKMKQQQSRKQFCSIDRSENFLRFEIQLTKIDIYKMKNKGLISENTVEQFMNIDICRHYIEQHYKNIIGMGDYYSYDKAIKKCKSADEKSILYLIKEFGSVYSAKEKYISRFTNKKSGIKKFSKIINDLQKQTINPVTLSDSTEKLENLYPLIKKYFETSDCVRITRRFKSNEDK